MSWQDDPEVQRQIRINAGRGKVFRSMLFWMPLFLATFVGTLWFGFDRIANDGDGGGTWFLVVLLTIITVLFGFQAIPAVLLHVGEAHGERGLVTRRWGKNDSRVLRAHYVRIGKRILRGDAYILDGIREGDFIEATFYPKSAVLIWAEHREDPARPAEAEERSARG